LKSPDADYCYVLKSLLNQPSSFEDGFYSPFQNHLSCNELNAVIKFLKLENNKQELSLNELKIFGRFRSNHELFFANVYDSLHIRQSSVCLWKYEDQDNYGIIEKFVNYKDKDMFIARKFIGKKKLIDYYKFSDTYKSIFELNDLDKYFTVFSRPGNDTCELIACSSSSIISTCVLTKLNDSGDVLVTNVIGYEHD